MNKNLLVKFLSFSYGSIASAGIAFITNLVVAQVLSPEEFGKSSMFLLFINIAMILVVFGTDQTFVRFYFEEEQNKRGGLIYNCLRISFILLAPILVLVVLFQKQLLNLLFMDSNIVVLIAIIISIVSQVLYRFGTLVVRMQQKGNTFSILELSNKLLILFGVIVLIRLFGNDYKVLVFSYVFGFGVLLSFLLYSQREFWRLKNIKESGLKHTRSEILSYSYPFVVTSAIMWLFDASDKFAIRHWSSFNELGLYTAAFKIIGILTILQLAFTTFWTPVAFEMFQKDPSNTSFFSKVARLVSFVMMFVGVLVIMMKDIIIMLLGKEYEGASVMLSFLVFVPIMYTISETTVVGLYFYKKSKIHVIIAGIVCVTNFVANILLVPHYGAIGASISVGSSYILFLILRTFFSLRYYKLDFGLNKMFFAIFILVIYAGYTISPIQPITNQFIGVLTLIALLFLYFGDIKQFLYKK